MPRFNDSQSTSRLADFRQQEIERRTEALAEQIGLPYIKLVGYTMNPEAIAMVPEKIAREINVTGFEFKHETLYLGTSEPQSPAVQRFVQQLQKKHRVELYLCSIGSLEHAWKRYADITTSTAEQKGVFEINPQNIAAFAERIVDRESISTILTNIKTINNARRVTETMEVIYAGALRLRASDIHIEPEETGVRIRYRLDGVLHDIANLDRSIFERLMSRFKLLSGMMLNQKNEAQDGRFTFILDEREIEVRASVIPGASGESIVMRLLDPTVASFSMDNLNLNEYIYAAMKRELIKPNGLIITTGPTGSGKTTALYAFLRETHQEGVKIITIENPVEYKLEGIVQTQTGGDYTFASGLRAILRQDPDVIMVGEIRDREVAETAIHAAQTGHLVFSTLHTNSAAAGFPRLIDLGVDARIFGSSINVMLGQRLVRKLCKHCISTYEASAEERAMIALIMETHPHPSPLPHPLILATSSGCSECGGTGFKGRAGIFEAILVDQAVEEVLVNDPREHKIVAAARPQGIPSMVEDGADKLLRHETSLSELQRVIELPIAPTTQAEPVLQTELAKNSAAAEVDFQAHIV